MDDGGTMNFAEYVALMSGNNDLLEKARMEKIIMALENERKAFNNNRSGTERKLEYIKYLLENEKKSLTGFLSDWDYLNEVAPANEKGKRANPVVLDGLEETASTKEIGDYLQRNCKHRDTFETVMKIGKLFDFDLAVKTYKDYDNKRYNMFFIIGRNGYMYTHNSGYLAETPEKASRYFISALERIPRFIENSKKDIEKMEQDIPILEKILENTWNNAPKLQKVKTELAALDRKIMATLSEIKE
jgi:hypothetical protein